MPPTVEGRREGGRGEGGREGEGREGEGREGEGREGGGRGKEGRGREGTFHLRMACTQRDHTHVRRHTIHVCTSHLCPISDTCYKQVRHPVTSAL